LEGELLLLLGREDIEKIFTMQDAIEADSEAFRIFSMGGSDVPLRTNINIPKYDGRALFMPGYVESLDSAGVKIVSVFPGNLEKNKPVVPATMVLVDGTTGEVVCIMDGTYVTQLRTGAASGVATDLLARKDASVAALIGTGGQAAMQLEALLTVRCLKEVRIYAPNREKARAFVATMSEKMKKFPAQLRLAETAADAVCGADIVTTATTAKQPVFDGRLIKAGTHINAIGSYMPSMQEIDEHIVERAGKIFCESVTAALAEAGDFVVPLKKGIISADKITGEIGQLIMGTLKGRESDDEITLFKSVGMAVVDIVTAYEIHRRAAARGIGIEFNF
jgi:ornithine cyclodeaminase